VTALSKRESSIWRWIVTATEGAPRQQTGNKKHETAPKIGLRLAGNGAVACEGTSHSGAWC
jgi:hypothetical protein